jgi:hypothetical protein
MTTMKLSQAEILANIKRAKALRAKMIQKKNSDFKITVTVKEDGSRVWSC